MFLPSPEQSTSSEYVSRALFRTAFVFLLMYPDLSSPSSSDELSNDLLSDSKGWCESYNEHTLSNKHQLDRTFDQKFWEGSKTDQTGSSR